MINNNKYLFPFVTVIKELKGITKKHFNYKAAKRLKLTRLRWLCYHYQVKLILEWLNNDGTKQFFASRFFGRLPTAVCTVMFNTFALKPRETPCTLRVTFALKPGLRTRPLPFQPHRLTTPATISAPTDLHYPGCNKNVVEKIPLPPPSRK